MRSRADALMAGSLPTAMAAPPPPRGTPLSRTVSLDTPRQYESGLIIISAPSPRHGGGVHGGARRMGVGMGSPPSAGHVL